MYSNNISNNDIMQRIDTKFYKNLQFLSDDDVYIYHFYSLANFCIYNFLFYFNVFKLNYFKIFV